MKAREIQEENLNYLSQNKIMINLKFTSTENQQGGLLHLTRILIER